MLPNSPAPRGSIFKLLDDHFIVNGVKNSSKAQQTITLFVNGAKNSYKAPTNDYIVPSDLALLRGRAIFMSSAH